MDTGADTHPASEPSRLRIERSGGFAGLHLKAEHEVQALGAAQRKALAQLLQRPPVAAAAAPAARRGAPAAADRFHYRVQLTFPDGRQQQLDLAEDDMPEALAGLVSP